MYVSIKRIKEREKIEVPNEFRVDGFKQTYFIILYIIVLLSALALVFASIITGQNIVMTLMGIVITIIVSTYIYSMIKNRKFSLEVKNKNIILNEGYCCVHNLVHLENVIKLKNEYPNAKILAHPECKEEILNLADYIGSTSGIIEEVLKGGDEFIIVTERGIQHKIYEKAPNKKLYFADTLICKSMKKNTLEKIEKILLEGGDELEVDDEIAKKALIPLERMLELAGD